MPYRNNKGKEVSGVYLKALELHGFKSFPEKTVLHFNPGSTIIVGPNGSGKSNITDAMRWVLGELSSKNIRGTKMEDVIFVGADGHRPMSFAEVSVTFDDSEEPRKLNCPYEEVTVTRRYYRAGESEYFINRKPCRLKDINELFMNTGIGREGYSIVGQGKIAEIISKKSEDRRGIFEETAGITKYRYKKNEAQKKLNETDENMTRILDIFTEIESRIGPLERDAQKARRYLELYDEKKRIDISLWLLDIEKIRNDVDKVASDCRHSAHDLEMAQDEETQLENKYQRLFDISQENKQKSAGLYEEIKRITEEIHSAENSYRLLENDILHAQTRISASKESAQRANEALEKELQYEAQQRERLSDNRNETDHILDELDSLQENKSDLTVMLAELGTKLEEALKDQQSAESEIADMTVRLEVLRASISDQSERETTVREDVAKYEAKLQNIYREAEDCRRSVETYEAALKKSDDAVGECDKQLLALSDKTEIARRNHSGYVASAEALASRISALKRMQEHFDGYNNSVKFVMNKSHEGRLGGIHGPLSSLIKVNEEYIVALETAFGAALQNIVVDDESSAKNAIRALKEAGAGRATFYPLSSIKGQDKTKELVDAARYPGFVGYANELLSCEEKYSDIVSSIVGRIAVFDNIDNASDVARRCGWKIRIVTLDGQQINMGGSFTGGSVRRDSGMLTRGAQIDKLQNEKKELDEKVALSEKELKKYTDKAAELTAYRRKEDEKAKLSEVLLRGERAQLDELEANINVTESLIAQLKDDMARLSEVGKRGGADAVALEDEINVKRAEADKIAAERENTAIERGQIEDNIDEITQKINTAQISLASLMRDAENINEMINASLERSSTLRGDADSYLDAVDDLTSGIEETRLSIAEKKKRAQELSVILSESEQKRAKLEESSGEYDKKLNEIRLQIKDVQAKKELHFRAHTANESKLERLNSEVDKMTNRLWDEYELTHSAAVALEYPAIEPDKRAASAARLSELKNSIRGLGHVNVGAIEEYTVLNERYEQMKTQIDDLTASKNELEKIVSSIEEEMKRMFADAFEKINRYFGETFRELFGGGSAHLTLTDPENILTSGVEISAAPPGKMVKNLNLLSGGEQAFVAIALIFALIRVNPSPFCIFDEIEAALDEVNVTRVANYVRRFSKELQIIMITHRRGMMETADTLYGVTMPRRGISKVFTLDVNAVAEKRADVDEFLK